ncbi:putative large neutral amino acids transporter small subunit 1 [Penaeus vannamei]|uniref:Putative large neutral amino acids transporter small subunit 1 n=1 Tax=Penaeus vannamei TaxID=6689 RepID=A0A423U940_PENVA|nr:putative large neutral amino acids transporter small subunit 1 [Penaeus vannamei]
MLWRHSRPPPPTPPPFFIPPLCTLSLLNLILYITYSPALSSSYSPFPCHFPHISPPTPHPPTAKLSERIANYLNFVIEELKDPVQNLPKAIYISISLVTVVYVLANVAFYTTLSPAEVLGSEAVAVTFANRLYGYMAWIMPFFVACSTFGAVNGVLLTSSRLFYAGALEGQMPEILTMIQVKRMTPTPAVLFMAFLSLAYLGSSNILALISYLSIGLAVVCVPLLRYTHPDLERPIKVNLVWPILYIIATIFITIVPMIAAPIETGMGVGMIATGVPVYFLFIYVRKPEPIRKMLRNMTIVLQRIMMVVRPVKS